MERHRLLDSIWTGYPRFKLKDEDGIPSVKIKTFPWLQAPFMASLPRGLTAFPRLTENWSRSSQETLDRHVMSRLRHPTTIIALSGGGLYSGAKAQSIGGHYICDRASSHIRFQDQLLREEYKLWGLEFRGIDPQVINREEAEYDQSEFIAVPSEFVKRSFIKMGVPEEKIAKVVFGARLERFKKLADPPEDRFRVLWVGAISIRKGFLYLLDAFRALKHPKKELIVIGSMEPEIKLLLAARNLEGVIFRGTVPNKDLPQIYSSAHVFVLASLEEGLACVQGEALACGCPVIATVNTGAEDLYKDGVEGFIVPIRSARAIYKRLQELADDSLLRIKMSEAAMQCVKSIGGWDAYGDSFVKVIKSLES